MITCSCSTGTLPLVCSDKDNTLIRPGFEMNPESFHLHGGDPVGREFIGMEYSPDSAFLCVIRELAAKPFPGLDLPAHKPCKPRKAYGKDLRGFFQDSRSGRRKEPGDISRDR